MERNVSSAKDSNDAVNVAGTAIVGVVDGPAASMCFGRIWKGQLGNDGATIFPVQKFVHS